MNQFANQLPQFEEEQPFNFQEWFFKILGIWKWIIASVFFFLALAFVYHRYAVSRYLISASMLVENKDKSMGKQLMEEVELFSSPVNLENEMAILKSRSFIAEVIDSLDFEVEYYREGHIKSSELYDDEVPFRVTVIENNEGFVRLSYYVKILGNGEFKLLVPGASDGPTYRFPAVITGDGYGFRIEKRMDLKVEEVTDRLYFVMYDVWSLAKSYQKQLDVGTKGKDASIIHLSAESHHVKKNQDFINAVINFYIQRDLEEKNLTATRTIQFIDDQLLRIQDALTIIEDSLQEFRTLNSIVNLSQKGEAILSEMQELETLRSNEEVKLNYFDYLMSYLKENRNPSSVVSPATVGVDNPILMALITNLNELSGKLSQVEVNATEENPQVQSLQLQIKRVMEGVMENVDNLKGNTQITLYNIDRRIHESELKMDQLPSTERKYIGIQRNFNLSENLFLYLQEKKAEAGIAKASNIPQVKIIDPAIFQDQTSPRKMRNYGLALILGLGLPIGILILMNLLNDKIQSVADIERRTQLSVLGVIGLSHYDTDLVLEKHPRSFIAENFRKLRSSMKFLEGKENTQILMITSFLSGDGKTFCSINMAIMMAKMGKKTLLLGLDMRKQKLHTVFNIPNERGISNVLNGELKVQEALQSTCVESLYMITGGDIPPNPNELVAGEQFEKILKELKSEFDCIVIDTPPVGLVSDALEMGKHVDLTLFIVRYNYTSLKAVDYIDEVEVKSLLGKVGLVLNGVDFDELHNRNAYSYGQNQGYYEN